MFFSDIAVGYPTDMGGILGLWAALILMLMIYSYPLYKENFAYRFAEHSYSAIMLALNLVVIINN
jgi:hypothetical protein